MNLLKNKKGQGSNYIAVVAFLMIFGFMNILGYTVWIQFVIAFESTGFSEGIIAQTILDWTKGFQAFDYVALLLLIIFILSTGLLSFRIKTKTAYFIVTFIMAIFWGFISYFFNYIFIQLVSQPVFESAVGFFPRTILICTNLHWVMLVLIIVGSITLYGKKEEEITTLT